MIEIAILGAALAVLLPIFLRRIHSSIRKHAGKRKELSYPFKLPVNDFELLKIASANQMPQTLLKWAKKYQRDIYTLREFLNGSRAIVVGNADLMRQILSDKDSMKPPKVYARTQMLTNGSNMFESNGERWFHARKAIMAAFSAKHIRRMSEVTSDKLKEFEEKLDANEGQSFDVGKEMINLTLKVICDAAFQYDMSTEEQELFLHGLEVVFRESNKSAIPLRSRFGRFIPAVLESRAAGKNLIALGRKILESYRKLEDPIKGTVIDRIASNALYKDDMERIADILILLVAGHDTTAYSIAWTLLELAKNPKEQDKLRADLEATPVGERLCSKVLHHVIKEGMRLHPVAAVGGARTVNKDILIRHSNDTSNLCIPKGSHLVLSNLMAFRSPKYFENPDEFQPSRWQNPTQASKVAYIPFSLGPRSCVGQSLANAEMKTVLSHLVANFKFKVKDEGSSTFLLTFKPISCMLVAERVQK